MLPIPIVLSMLASLAAYNQVIAAQAVQTAARTAALAGAAAGPTSAAAATKP